MEPSWCARGVNPIPTLSPSGKQLWQNAWIGESPEGRDFRCVQVLMPRRAGGGWGDLGLVWESM